MLVAALHRPRGEAPASGYKYIQYTHIPHIRKLIHIPARVRLFLFSNKLCIIDLRRLARRRTAPAICDDEMKAMAMTMAMKMTITMRPPSVAADRLTSCSLFEIERAECCYRMRDPASWLVYLHNEWPSIISDCIGARRKKSLDYAQLIFYTMNLCFYEPPPPLDSVLIFYY